MHPLPTTWVAAAADTGAADYGQKIAETSKLVLSDSLYAAMKVVGVPVAVLLRADTVVEVGRYDGDLDRTGYERACGGPS